MKKFLAFIDHPVFFTFCVATVFGMASWDLVFEGQRVLDAESIRAVQIFYAEFQTGESPMLLVLLASLVFGLVHLVRRIIKAKNMVSITALALYVIMWGLELGIAAPAEMAFVAMDSALLASEADLEIMREYIHLTEKLHYIMLALIITLVVLCRDSAVTEEK